MTEVRRARGHLASASGPRSARGGFTLLEVLAAVAILAIWYVALAGTGMGSLRAEGDSRRMLEAGMLADRHLADALANTADGADTMGGDSELEKGQFRIVTQLGGFRIADGSEQEASPELSPYALAAGDDALPLDLPGLLESEMAGFVKHIRSIRVVVSWTEGRRERHVERSTFVFDVEEAKKVYSSDEVAEQEAGGPAEESGGSAREALK